MKRLACVAALLAAPAAFASDQEILDRCIAAWGNESPFKKGKPADTVIGGGVRVFGVGSSQALNDAPTDQPALILVRPAVNVAGRTTIRLSNPNGWYCFSSNVTVAGALNIEAQCKARVMSAREDGTTVGAVDQSGKGVAVFGALRLTRFGCPDAEKK